MIDLPHPMARTQQFKPPKEESTELQRFVWAIAWLPYMTDRELITTLQLRSRRALYSLREEGNAKAMHSIERALRAFIVPAVKTNLVVTSPLGTCRLHMQPARPDVIKKVHSRYAMAQVAALARGRAKAKRPHASGDQPANFMTIAKRMVQTSVATTYATCSRPLDVGEVVCPDLGAAFRDLVQRRGIGLYELTLATGAGVDTLTHVMNQTGRITGHIETMSKLLGAAGIELQFTVDRTLYRITQPAVREVIESVQQGYAAGRAKPKPGIDPEAVEAASENLDEEDAKEMLRLVAKGATFKFIGKRIDRTGESVRRLAQKYAPRTPHDVQRRAAAHVLTDLLNQSSASGHP